MNNYINAGIIKSMSLFYKNENNLADILCFLQEHIDLNLFHMEKKDNCLLFDLNNELLNKYFLDFLKEIKLKGLYKYESLDETIKYLNKNNNKDICDLLGNLDDIFIDNLDINDYSVLSNKLYNIDITYIVFYFEGPILCDNNINFLNLFLKLFHNSLTNKLKNALCFGISK